MEKLGILCEWFGEKARDLQGDREREREASIWKSNSEITRHVTLFPLLSADPKQGGKERILLERDAEPSPFSPRIRSLRRRRGWVFLPDERDSKRLSKREIVFQTVGSIRRGGWSLINGTRNWSFFGSDLIKVYELITENDGDLKNSSDNVKSV